MKIALLDLNHMTCGIHNNTVPLGIGLIAVYLKKQINKSLDIKLFKEVDKSLATFKSWIPDILGITQYCWNSELNLHVAKLVKNINPNCIIIAGGPNLELSSKGKSNFLKTNSHVDICVEYDGEIPFTNIINRILSRESIDKIKKTPSPGTYSLDKTGYLIESSEQPPRLTSLDDFGSIYTDGIFDEFLQKGYNPLVQTNRGCPFTCTFCHASNPYYSHVSFLSPDLFKKDMEYLGKFFADRHNVLLYITNSNMSFYKQDFEIAKIIKEIQKKYNWPRFIQVSSGKDTKKLLDILSIIKFQPSIALQTLTPNVSKNIKRRNIDLESYCAFQKQVLIRTEETSTTDLILPLPGETKETFLKTLKTVINSGVQNFTIFTLMNLKGTPLASEESADRYGYIIRHRIVPRQFSVVNSQKIFDSEEVIIGTKDMPFEDYLELRGICFTIITFFGSTELIPLKKFLLEYNIDIAEWIFNVHENLPKYPDLYTIYTDFLKETQEELFPTREALVEFFNKPENYKDLLTGKRGDNLIRKYKCIALSENYETYLKFAALEAKKLVYEKLTKEKADQLIDNLFQCLSTRNMKHIISENKLPQAKTITLDYDIPSWLKCTKENKTLEEFKGIYSYLVQFTSNTKQRLNKFLDMNKDKTLSLQILFRDGGIKDLWPVWTKQPNKNAEG